MADAKLEIKVGEISFTGEGAESWLAQQLDKILAKLPELMSGAENGDSSNNGDSHSEDKKTEGLGNSGGRSKTTLAAFLKEKKATTNQARRYLATATWLQDVEGKNRLTTSDVTKALNEHNQGRLSNPAQCLIHNASRGMVAKDGKKQFYVTDDGRAELEK